MRTRTAVVLPVIAVLVAGCGKPEANVAPVKGKLVTPGGAPFHAQRPIDKPLPPGDPGVQVKFTSLDSPPGPGDPQPFFNATIDPDTGTFEVPGLKGTGIPPGKYRVTVYVGAVGEGVGADTGSAGVPPPGEDGAEDNTGLDGKEVSRTEVTVPPEGLTDLTVEVKVQKKR